MSLQLYYHPFASFCQKVLIAFYEQEIAFKGCIVDLGDAKSRAQFLAVWPIGKFPVLRDEERQRMIPESSIIIEYLAQHFPGGTTLLPSDPHLAFEVRLWDRFYDCHVETPMAKIVTDRLRPEGQHDLYGVKEARSALETSYAILDKEMAHKRWAAGDAFSMADCAAAPALYYAQQVQPISATQVNLLGFYQRLLDRPSFARVLEEAEPYRHLFPQ